MLNIQPFCGLRYNRERIGDLSSVICPPYDVLSLEKQQLYHQRSPYNAVRLELGSPEAGDRLRSWLDEGVLCLEQRPAFYILENRFLHQGVTKHRWGLLARVRLGDWVHPHEVTLEEDIHNRLNLLRSLKVNTSPILGIIRQEGLLSLLPQLARGEPELSVTDDYGVTHNLWIVPDELAIAEISTLCADKVIYIGDGHHRYKAALAYQREKQTPSRDEASNFIMMALMEAQDPGLVILPTHRLVKLSQSPAWLKEKISRFFSWEELPPIGLTTVENLDYWLREQGKRGKAIGDYGLVPKHFCLLEPREDKEDLEVSLLHRVILPQILGIDSLQKEREYLEYTRDGLEAIHRVDSGGYLAFFLNPTPISSLLDITDKGKLIPPKSTYFYPKLPAGLVMNPLWV